MSEPGGTEHHAPAPPEPRPVGRGRLRRGSGCIAFLILLAVAISGWVVAYRVSLHEPRPELDEAIDRVAESVGTSRRNIELSGRGDLRFDRFAVTDHQGHTVLEVGGLRGDLDLAALRDGVFRLRGGEATGVTLRLRRGPSGRISLAEVFQPATDPATAGGAGEGEAEEGDGGGAGVRPPRAELRLDVAPVELRDVTLIVELGERPMRIAIDSARMSMRTRPEGGHRIRISRVRGRLLEPDLFPQPVRIADAIGSIRLGYGHLIDLKTRMCIGRGEIRTRVVLPARRRPVDVTVDSRGVLGAMMRLGVVVAAARNPDRIRATTGYVAMSGGEPCTRRGGLAERAQRDEELRPMQQRRLGRQRRRQEADAPSQGGEGDGSATRTSRREQRREERSQRRARRRTKHPEAP